MTGPELKLWREARGLSRQQLAAHLGMHMRALQRWELGTRHAAGLPAWVPLALRGLEADGLAPPPR